MIYGAIGYEKPKHDPGRTYHRVDISEHLPIEARNAGMTLQSFEPGRGPDPIVLYDNDRHIIKQWPEVYIPTLVEVWDEVRRALSL